MYRERWMVNTKNRRCPFQRVFPWTGEPIRVFPESSGYTPKETTMLDVVLMLFIELISQDLFAMKYLLSIARQLESK